MNWAKPLMKKEAAADTPVSGPGIDMLINTVHNMRGLGAPVEFDDQGFNKIHYNHPFILALLNMSPGTAIPTGMAIWAVQALGTYKNRQVSNWALIKQAVDGDIRKATPLPAGGPVQPAVNGPIDKTVKFIGQGKFGKMVYEIQGITKFPPGMKGEIAEIMEGMYNGGNRNFAPQTSQFNGQTEFPIYKAITKSKEAFDQFEINPMFAPIIAKFLESKGYNVTALQQVQTTQDGKSAAPQKKAITVVKDPANDSGIKVSFDYDPTLIAWIKGLPFKNRKWDGTSRTWDFNGDKAFFSEVKGFFEKHGFDVSAFDAIVNTLVDKPKTNDMLIEASELQNGSVYRMSVRVTRDPKKNEFIKSATQYCFPEYGVSRNFDKATYTWQLNGSRSQFGLFSEVLEQNGFDMSKVRALTEKLADEGKILKDKTPGILDGFEKDGKNDVEAFDKKVDAKFATPLYDKQKDGVRFLYSRQSGVMGDETGAGKTYQMIAAASMRMDQSGGRTLIVTLASTQIQWMKAIESFTKGEKASTDPTSDAKWVVTYYNMFANHQHVKNADGTPVLSDPANPKSVVKKRDQLTKDVMRQHFSVLILDESHSVKNDNTTTDNISAIAEKIPYKWGASATLIANKAIDAYNQLRIIGHPLGKLSKGKFKREFAGMVSGGYNGAYVDGTPEQQLEAAANLRKWLVKTGAYIKRTKKDINPNMPNHTISNNPIDLDEKAFDKAVAKRLEKYKDSSLEISKMIAQRTEAALMKVPATLELASNVLSQGKKVLVFTCFIEPAKALAKGLETSLADMDGGTVELVVGNLDRAGVQAAVERFKLDPNSKAMVLSILKGGTGIDLPNVVEDVFINDFSWTPKDAEQSEGRAFRISSTSDVNTTYVVAQNNPDSKMFEYVQHKKSVAKMIQDLEAQERESIMKGLSVVELKNKIKELQKQDVELDKSVSHLISNTKPWPVE